MRLTTNPIKSSRLQDVDSHGVGTRTTKSHVACDATFGKSARMQQSLVLSRHGFCGEPDGQMSLINVSTSDAIQMQVQQAWQYPRAG